MGSYAPEAFGFRGVRHPGGRVVLIALTPPRQSTTIDLDCFT
jgi:hypothetical protein